MNVHKNPLEWDVSKAVGRDGMSAEFMSHVLAQYSKL